MDKNHSEELKAECLHFFKATLTTLLVEAQQAGALDDTPLQFEDEIKRVIIGDVSAGDKLCCTTCRHLNKLNWLCCKCNVPLGSV